MQAAKGGHLNVVKLLLESGAQPECVDIEGRSTLHHAAANDHIEIASLLLAQGVSGCQHEG